jgi:hypothetical protein
MKAIVRLKSFPNHKGIPGHQGGSLPEGESGIELGELETNYIASMQNQVDNFRNDPTNEYKRQQAVIIQNRIDALKSGKEAFPAWLYEKPKATRTKKPKAATVKGSGHADRVDPNLAKQAYDRAHGDKKAAYSQVVIMTSLRPGFDNVDLQAWFRENGY